MRKREGFNLIEVLVVLVIIGTLAALAWPNYMAIKEKTLNREVKASLALIRAAEKIYKMEQGYYYPYSTTTSTVPDINSYLKLSLPETASVNWSISLDSSASPEFAQAARTASDGRIWKIEFPGEAEPTCSGGTNCR
jgi:prepilin-type N-terminal cleavage/methylation domain-containing protein